MRDSKSRDVCCTKSTCLDACNILGFLTIGLLTVGGSTAIFLYADSLTAWEDALLARWLGGFTIAAGVIGIIFYAVVNVMVQHNKEMSSAYNG